MNFAGLPATTALTSLSFISMLFCTFYPTYKSSVYSVYSAVNFSPNVREILPLPSCKDIPRLAVKNAAFQKIASTEVSEAKPPFFDKRILSLLSLGQLAEITLKHLVSVCLPIGVFLMLFVVALLSRLRLSWCSSRALMTPISPST